MSFKEVAACFISLDPFWVFLPARCSRSFLKTQSIDAEGQKKIAVLLRVVMTFYATSIGKAFYADYAAQSVAQIACFLRQIV